MRGIKNNLDIWMERLDRECGIKGSIILSGNINDLMFNRKKHRYDSILQCTIDKLLDKGFDSIIKWDRIEGIDKEVSDLHLVKEITESQKEYCSSQKYEFDDERENTVGSYKDIDEFFSVLLKLVRCKVKKTAVILDYSDYIFGSGNAFSESEKNWLGLLGKSLQETNEYDMYNPNFMEISNIIIIATAKLTSIPSAFYINNSMVKTIEVPLPGRREREHFLRVNQSCLKIKDTVSEECKQQNFEDFIDALDNFTIKDIAQIIKLSRQIVEKNEEPLTQEALVNLYRYGEKNSPWEELSKEKLTVIEKRLNERVKGQDHALAKVKEVIIRAYTGFSGLQHSTKQKKPKGILFFVGPTGVGKTELAKSIAQYLFGDENACIRFDMSEFNHEHSDQRLVGAPPGYVGFEEGGQLTNAVKRRPFSVLLFDEIEKAHGRILDKFLQILEDGRLTDGKGETIYFSETIIIFTSNIGAKTIDPKGQSQDEIRRGFINKVKEHFIEKLERPELLNRIGENIVAFNYIEDIEVFESIASGKLQVVKEFVEKKYGVELFFENEKSALRALAEKADKRNGGRGVLNTIEEFLVNPLSNFIFENLELLRRRKSIEVRQCSSKRAYFEFEVV